jgi:hypothetical protein
MYTYVAKARTRAVKIHGVYTRALVLIQCCWNATHGFGASHQHIHPLSPTEFAKIKHADMFAHSFAMTLL